MIPWSALVRHAPALLAAADTLLARARTGKAESAADTAERFRRLEQSAGESAQLLHDIVQQLHALTAMQEKAEKRARIALTLGIVAVGLAAAAALAVFLT